MTETKAAPIVGGLRIPELDALLKSLHLPAALKPHVVSRSNALLSEPDEGKTTVRLLLRVLRQHSGELSRATGKPWFRDATAFLRPLDSLLRTDNGLARLQASVLAVLLETGRTNRAVLEALRQTSLGMRFLSLQPGGAYPILQSLSQWDGFSDAQASSVPGAGEAPALPWQPPSIEESAPTEERFLLLAAAGVRFVRSAAGVGGAAALGTALRRMDLPWEQPRSLRSLLLELASACQRNPGPARALVEMVRADHPVWLAAREVCDFVLAGYAADALDLRLTCLSEDGFELDAVTSLKELADTLLLDAWATGAVTEAPTTLLTLACANDESAKPMPVAVRSSSETRERGFPRWRLRLLELTHPRGASYVEFDVSSEGSVFGVTREGQVALYRLRGDGYGSPLLLQASGLVFRGSYLAARFVGPGKAVLFCQPHQFLEGLRQGLLPRVMMAGSRAAGAPVSRDQDLCRLYFFSTESLVLIDRVLGPPIHARACRSVLEFFQDGVELWAMTATGGLRILEPHTGELLGVRRLEVDAIGTTGAGPVLVAHRDRSQLVLQEFTMLPRERRLERGSRPRPAAPSPGASSSAPGAGLESPGWTDRWAEALEPWTEVRDLGRIELPGPICGHVSFSADCECVSALVEPPGMPPSLIVWSLAPASSGPAEDWRETVSSGSVSHVLIEGGAAALVSQGQGGVSVVRSPRSGLELPLGWPTLAEPCQLRVSRNGRFVAVLTAGGRLAVLRVEETSV